MYLLLVTCALSASFVVTQTPDNEPVDAEKLQIIFPGTKWCGQGNIATDNEDLGIFADTDTCCRNHDMCPKFISAGETKYNLTNTAMFTKVACECDEEFHACLKATESAVSLQVGATYFDLVGSECFKLEYPIVRCSMYSEVVKTRCLKYEVDSTQEKMWQFFDNMLY